MMIWWHNNDVMVFFYDEELYHVELDSHIPRLNSDDDMMV